jgi:hypothetical protein
MTDMNIDQRGHPQKTVTLRDAGGWYLFPIFLGIPVVGVVLDYFWNFLVLFLSLRCLHISVSTNSKFIYCLMVTGGGLLIDLLYYVITWGVLELGAMRERYESPRWGTESVLELLTILIPIVLIAGVNYAVSRLFLRVDSKQAVILAAIMGFFTAPWAIVIYLVFID